MNTVPRELNVKFENKRFKTDISWCKNVADVKRQLCQHTGLTPTEHKFVNLKLDGKPVADDCDLALLKFNPYYILNVERVFVPQYPSTSTAPGLSLADSQLGRRLINAEMTENWRGFKILQAPRQGKPLLVLDIDDTILDCKVPPYLLTTMGARPHLQDFLKRIYVHFDIAIWSAVPMSFLESKISALRMNNNELYKIAFYVDRSVMTVTKIPAVGFAKVKHLQEIWRRFPQYAKFNTMLCDDSPRNIFLNKTNALLVMPYHYGSIATDDELVKVGKYLLFLARCSLNFSWEDHSSWRTHKSVVP